MALLSVVIPAKAGIQPCTCLDPDVRRGPQRGSRGGVASRGPQRGSRGGVASRGDENLLHQARWREQEMSRVTPAE
jgi:hypothetical protein